MKRAAFMIAISFLFVQGSATAQTSSEGRREQTREAPTAYSGADQSALAFLVEAAKTNTKITGLARLAEERSTSPFLKDTAEQMLTAHEKLNFELKKLFASKQISFPQAAPSEASETFARLNRLADEKFDQAFLDELEEEHNDLLLGIKRQLTDVQDPEIRRWLEATENVIEQHQSALQTMKRQLR